MSLSSAARVVDPVSERETLARLQLAVEASGEVVFMTDREGVFNYVNPEFVRVYGYTPAEVVGRHTPRILSGGLASREEYADFWQRLKNQEVVRREFTNKTRTGQIVFVESSANPIVADGACVGFLAVQRDITERKSIEIALRESENRYRTLAEAADDSIFIVKRDATIEYANAISVKRFGIRVRDAAGRKLHDVFTAAVADEMWDQLLRVFDTEQRCSFETRIDAPGGSLWLETSLVPMPGPAGPATAVMGVARDVTGRKRLEQQYAQAQKMEAIGRLAGGIAHDFNNLLTAILGYSELVLDRVHENPSLAPDVEEIKKAGERASRLTRQLLAFSRQQALEPQVLDLNAVITELQRLLDRVIGEDVRLDVVGQSGLPRVKADPGQIEQLILNLVVNARDAMPQGGRLRISTAAVTIDRSFVERYPSAVPGRFVSLAVADNGCGMAPEVLSHVFEPFFTTKPPGKGTGLGLATVFCVVQQSGGFVTVDSAPGAGTTVTAYLPVTADECWPDSTTSTRSESDGRETILLVEDEGGIRQLMQRALERHGYTVLVASTAAEAIAAASAWPTAIDLLLSDVVMPDLGGPELAQRIVGLRPSIRVLYVTGYPSRVGHGSAGMGSHAMLLPKPFTPHALSIKVRECLDARGNSPLPAK